MTRQSYSKSAILVLTGMLMEAEGFAPQQQPSRLSGSSLNLLPTQGKQLVAAYEASTCKSQEDVAVLSPSTENVNAPTTTTTETGAIGAARAFVSRVFHLPSHFVPHRDAVAASEDGGWVDGLRLPQDATFAFYSPEEPDVVLFPVVGFKFVEDEDHHARVLPTTTNVSCRLRETHNEELYGWFSPSCPLNMFAEDPCVGPADKI